MRWSFIAPRDLYLVVTSERKVMQAHHKYEDAKTALAKLPKTTTWYIVPWYSDEPKRIVNPDG